MCKKNLEVQEKVHKTNYNKKRIINYLYLITLNEFRGEGQEL